MFQGKINREWDYDNQMREDGSIGLDVIYSSENVNLDCEKKYLNKE